MRPYLTVKRCSYIGVGLLTLAGILIMLGCAGNGTNRVDLTVDAGSLGNADLIVDTAWTNTVSDTVTN
jgi:hypothetical protein